MRVLFSMLAAASLASLATAQFEGFEPGPATPGAGPVPAGWTSVNNSVGGPGTNPNWQVRNDGQVFPANTGSTYAFANYNAATGANNISLYLISPQVTIANGATISFWTRTLSTVNFPDSLSLVFNTTGSTLPADFTNTLVQINPTLTTTGYPTVWTQYTATVAGVTGSVTGRYAFHYNPTNGGPAGANSDYVGIDDVTFTPAGSGNVLATNTTLGAGCVRQFNSFYERFADATLASTALSGNTLQLIPAGTGYQGVWLPGTASAFFVPPVAGTPLATADDGVVTYAITSGSFPTAQGPQSSVLVSGNGIVAWGGAAMDYPGSNSYTPTAPAFLNSTLGGLYAWHDYNVAEAGSGQILAEEVAGVLYITFNGVESYSTPAAVNPSTLQFQLDLASGVVRMVFVSIDSDATSAFGSGHLIGVSSPGTSANPGSIALATASAAQLLTQNPEVLPLALAATSRPVIGTNWNLTTSNVPATGLIGVDVFGIADPGINDLFFLGAPGCGLRASLDATSAWFVAGATHTYSLAIPNSPSLVNLNLYTTSAVFQVPPVNAFGAITSNGIQGKVGDF
jgi:hypothetical protein